MQNGCLMPHPEDGGQTYGSFGGENLDQMGGGSIAEL